MNRRHVVILSGALEGQEFGVAGSTTTIGRHPGNQIMLDDPQISRNHARIELSPRGAVLRDLGSGNGTYIDGQRVLEHVLNDGEVFRVGPVDLRYDTREHPSRECKVRLDGESGIRLEEAPFGEMHVATPQGLVRDLLKSDSPDGEYHRLVTAEERLSALYSANQIISSEHDLKTLFARVMDQVYALVPAGNGVILLTEESSADLVPVYERNLSGSAQITVSSTIVERAFQDREAVLVDDAAEDARFQGSESVIRANIASAMCVPLLHREEVLGVVYVDTQGKPSAFTEQDLELLVALAAPAAIAIKGARHVEELEEDFESTLRLLANAIELRDHYTVGHTWRVTNFSIAIAQELGWSEAQIRTVERGGLLHDVGKIAVPDAVLRKTGRLTPEETAQMRIHPEKGASLLQDHKKLRELVPYCLYHHERYDGKGYPFGLKADQIPIEGRLVAVADTFDAITSNRPYHKGRPADEAVKEIIKNKGKQFDPDCVDAFVRAYKAGKINHILQAYHENDEKSLACAFCSTYIPMPGDVSDGDVIVCPVCHRDLRLEIQNDVYVGILLTESGEDVETPTQGS